jgi:hypothetical protein
MERNVVEWGNGGYIRADENENESLLLCQAILLEYLQSIQ